MFWSLVGAILFVFIGLPAIIYGAVVLFSFLYHIFKDENLKQLATLILTGFLALFGFIGHVTTGRLFDFSYYMILFIPFFIAIYILNKDDTSA